MSRRLGVAIVVVSMLASVGCRGSAELIRQDDDGGREASALAGTVERVTFVQWTDLHLFDAGTFRHGRGVLEEGLDNRAALHWAVLETNRLVLLERRAIDFVVITGDFGLDNVQLPPSAAGTMARKCVCPRRLPDQEGPIEPVTLAEAVTEVARELRALLVNRVYLVPGDADLCGGDARDLHRWAEFVYALRVELAHQHRQLGLRLTNLKGGEANPAGPPQIEDLTYCLERLHAAHDPRIMAIYAADPSLTEQPPLPPTVNGIHLLGLNSAFCIPHRDPGAQMAADRAAASDIDFVERRIVSGASHLLFTHVPEIPAPARARWHDAILGRHEVIAAFAGHVHAGSRVLYPRPVADARTPLDPLIAGKQWWAPPLAALHQWPAEKTARGMLLVTVTGTGAVRASGLPEVRVEPAPLWYATLDQRAAIDGDDKLAQASLSDLDFAWEDAAAKYGEALESQDSRTRATAMRELRRVHDEMRAWWWQAGKYLPPVRWAGLYPLRAALVFVILVGALLARLLSRRVTLLDVEALSPDAPTAWFGRELLLAQREIIGRLRREARAHQVGGFRGGFILSAPSSTFDPVIAALESLQGTNAKGIASLIVAVWRYVGWSAKASVGISGNVLSAFAVRHFASFDGGACKESAVVMGPPVVPPAHPDLSRDLPRVARRLAARIVGRGYARSW